MSVVVEYHEHQPVASHIGGKPGWVCSYTRIDGTSCPDFYLGPHMPWNWSGVLTTSREAVEAHMRGVAASDNQT